MYLLDRVPRGDAASPGVAIDRNWGTVPGWKSASILDVSKLRELVADLIAVKQAAVAQRTGRQGLLLSLSPSKRYFWSLRQTGEFL